jgi:hypothetical protein
MKKINFIFLFICILILASCKKDSSDALLTPGKLMDQLSLTSDFIDALGTQYNGRFGFQFERSIGTSSTSSGSLIMGGFVNNSEGEPIAYGDLTMGSQVLTANSSANNMYGLLNTVSNPGNYFGTDIDVSLDNTNNQQEFSTTLYSPATLFVGAPSDGELSNGDGITWNADQANDKGVLLIVRYIAKDPSNKAFYDNGWNTNLVNYDYVENDNGSCNLSAGLFSGIPNGALVTLHVIRGNFSTSEINGKIYQVYSRVSAAGSFKYVEIPVE